jgi:glycyl-tRNA synthetase
MVLRCSHTFNVLDARGAVSTTERAKAFGRMRTLAREVSRLWAERRTELEHPLGIAELPAAVPQPTEFPASSGTRQLTFEIGTEEMPPSEVTKTAEAVRAALEEKLAATRLGHGAITTYATPRRVVAFVASVQAGEPDAERVVRGPRKAAAYDADGNVTKAAAGFARGQGVDVSELHALDVEGVEYVAVTKPDPGRGAAEVLSGVLSEIVSGLRSDKNMRWNDAKLSFTRPVRWLVALLGDQIVPVSVSSLAAGRTTRVHRTAAQPQVEIASAEGYLDLLRIHGIEADPARRREQIVTASRELATGAGGGIDFEGESALVDQIVNLVEEPTAILGGFEAAYLDLPGEILTTVMRKHQRYLPVRDADGKLLPHFVAVANGSVDEDLVRGGNEAVLRARYEDAAFFWRADLETSLEDMKSELNKLAFEERLGSMADRAGRIGRIALALADVVELSEDDLTTLKRAAELAKFDLGSQMVVELTSLAGTMAREYARRAGETEGVAQALFDMELPRSAGDPVPSTTPGALLALADRFDLLAGLFGIGAKPTGSSDPFALRRAAAGVVAILREHPELRAITLPVGLKAAAAEIGAQGIDVPAESLDEVSEFTVRRYEQQLLDRGDDHHQVAAVLPLATAPVVADEALKALQDLVGNSDFAELVAVLQRVRRIVPEGTEASYDSSTLTEPADVVLHEAVQKVGQAPTGLADFAGAASVLVEPVTTFFDEILVMAEDPEIRAARLGLLATISQLAAPVLDWQALGTSLTAAE